jgi:hypothetical protein
VTLIDIDPNDITHGAAAAFVSGNDKASSVIRQQSSVQVVELCNATGEYQRNAAYSPRLTRISVDRNRAGKGALLRAVLTKPAFGGHASLYPPTALMWSVDGRDTLRRTLQRCEPGKKTGEA